MYPLRVINVTKEEIQNMLDDLDEYKTEFDNQIMIMKAKGIKYSYDQTTREIEELYSAVKETLSKSLEKFPEYESLDEQHKSFFMRRKVIGMCVFLFKIVLLSLVMFILGKSNSSGEKALAVLCGIMGCKAENLIQDDLDDRFVKPYGDNESLKHYYHIEDEIFDDKYDSLLNMKVLIEFNKSLRKDLIKRKRIRRKRARERDNSVIYELKG